MHINVEDYGFPLQPSLLKTNTSPFLENEIIDWFDSLYGCDIAIISNRFDNERKTVLFLSLLSVRTDCIYVCVQLKTHRL